MKSNDGNLRQVMDTWFLDDQKTTEDVLKMVLNMAEHIEVSNHEEVEVGLAVIAEAMERLLAEAKERMTGVIERG